MKSYLANIQASTQTSYANNGKTTILGRAYQKTINSQSVIGPGLTQFIDVQTLVGFIPSMSYFNAATNHLFFLGPVSASPTVALFNFNNLTGAYSYVGKITMSLANAAATTEVWRGFKVYETGGLIYPVISSTGSVVINGGNFVAWGLSTSDFTVGGTTIYSASSSNQKACYFLQDPAALGSLHVATTSWGIALPQTSSSSSVNTKFYQFNGTLAAPSIYSWDLSLTPAVAGTITNGISSSITAFAGTSPVAYLNMGSSNNGYANGDQVVLMNGTVTVAGSFNAWFTNITQVAGTNVYFVRDLQLVSGTYYFNLATTSGGSAIVPSSTVSGFTMMRAFGICSSLFNFKTAQLPAFTLGAILQNNSIGYAKPVSAPANTALNGQDCIYMLTTTGLYIGKISDLASGSGAWASMTFSGVNITGTGIDITAPTVISGTYSGENSTYGIDRFIYGTNTSTYVVKPYQASNISTVFGGQTDTYYETLNPVTVQAGLIATTDISCYGGWMFICGNTIGQRGCVFVDLYSDASFGGSSVISPVLTVPAGSILKYINSIEQLFDQTDSMNFFIRSAATTGDSLFSSATGGWTSIKTAQDLSATAIGPAFQLMAQFQIATLDANTPAQINDFVYTVVPVNEMSDYWEGSVDNTTQNGATPAYTAFRMTQPYGVAYSSTVPTLYFRAYDDSGNLVASANTAANPTLFQYTTTNGGSWTNLGTIPNTALTTEIRYVWATPPGVRVTSSIRES